MTMQITRKAAVALLLLALVPACRCNQPDVVPEGTPGAPRPAQGLEETAPEDDPVVARQAGSAVSDSDIDREIRRRAMLQSARPSEIVPAERRHTAELVYAVAESVLEGRLLIAQGQRLELMPGPDELADAWRAHPDLGRLFTTNSDELAARLAPWDLDLGDVHHLLTAELVSQRWLAEVAARVDDDALREVYWRDNRTVTATLVEVANIPTVDEIARFVADPPTADWFEQQYRERANEFRRRESRDVRIVGQRIDADAGPAERDEARRSLEALRAEVQAGAAMDAMSVQRSTHPVARRGGLQHRAVRRQLPEAFELDLNELGPVIEDRFGLAFYRVERIHEPGPRPLDDNLRREMAARHLAEVGPTAEGAALAARAAAALAANDTAELDELVASNRVSVRELGPFARDPDGMIPGVGRSETLTDVLFGLTIASPATETPVQVGRRFFMARLVARTDPTEEAFQARLPEVRANYLRTLEDRAWDAFWQSYCRENPIHFDPPEDYLIDTKD